MAVPYTFANATVSIPLSQLDSNFATAITLGNTAIQLGNTVTTLNNMTLANVTITSGSTTNVVIATRVVTIPDGTSITINANTTDIAEQNNTQAAGTLTINAPTGTPTDGQKILIRLQSANVQTFSWNGVFQACTDVSLPGASSGSSKYDYIGFIYNAAATKWQIIAKVFGF